jgi:hypothetical protein
VFPQLRTSSSLGARLNTGTALPLLLPSVMDIHFTMCLLFKRMKMMIIIMVVIIISAHAVFLLAT